MRKRRSFSQPETFFSRDKIELGSVTVLSHLNRNSVGANKGLGYVLLRSTSTMDIELTFAVLVVLTIIGIAINYVVEFGEWAMTPWQRAGNS